MKKIFGALLSGLLLAFSWPAIGIFPLIFFAFVPLLILEDKAENGKKIFGYSYISFLVFNIITTYWVWYSTPVGAIFAFLVNSLLMTIAFYVFHRIKKTTKNRVKWLMYLCNIIKNNKTQTNNFRHNLLKFAKKTAVYN